HVRRRARGGAVTPRRRTFIGGLVATTAFAACSRRVRWERGAVQQTATSRVAIVPASAYDDRLVDVVRRGIRMFALDVARKTVVLKPNFVEFDPAAVINTHPALVGSAIEAFRREGARHVIVAEGPGHHRDTEHVLTASGLQAVLRDTRARYVDLNGDDVRAVPLRSHYTGLRELYLPETVLKADLLVSMPKLKTHHWAGVTLSM